MHTADATAVHRHKVVSNKEFRHTHLSRRYPVQLDVMECRHSVVQCSSFSQSSILQAVAVSLWSKNVPKC